MTAGQVEARRDNQHKVMFRHRSVTLLVWPFIVLFAARGPHPVSARTVTAAQPGTRVCADSASLRWEPTSPRQGALFRVRVLGLPSGAQLAGDAGGEALHFVPTRGEQGAESFAAVPVDGDRTIALRVLCIIGEQVDTLTASVEAARADYPVERLRVAPGFARQPDSALAARIRRESQRAAEIARQSHTTPRLWELPFVLPRTARVTSGFGRGREYNGSLTSRHMGTDFAGVTGAPVHAANRGVVRIVDAFFYGGNVVYIDHGDGLTSAYLHLSEQLVAQGDTVERAQPIGKVGATGRVTGPHLHLIVRYGSVTVDPMSLFGLAGDSVAARRAAQAGGS
jgi:murein DD-endopeptidase MepM/ murein hydrolase activator NlpD